MDSNSFLVTCAPLASYFRYPNFSCRQRANVLLHRPRQGGLQVCSSSSDRSQDEQYEEPPIGQSVTSNEEMKSETTSSRLENDHKDPMIAKGQRTAIWTGAVSVVFGIAYLILVQFLDLRGGELLPPPPEAYLQ